MNIKLSLFFIAKLSDFKRDLILLPVWFFWIWKQDWFFFFDRLSMEKSSVIMNTHWFKSSLIKQKSNKRCLSYLFKFLFIFVQILFQFSLFISDRTHLYWIKKKKWLFFSSFLFCKIDAKRLVIRVFWRIRKVFYWNLRSW